MTAPEATRVALSDLQDIVGREHAWEAAESDSIDGMQPRFVAEPGSTDEASAILRLANESGLAVSPRGNGTKLDWGNPPQRLDLILSTRRLDRTLEHAEGDLVIRAGAGVPLARLQEAVNDTDQKLAVDPTAPEGTVGGLIAANDSGPRRYRYGTVRDLLIGITYILPDGTIAKAGGRVVKNVAGYDLGKLFTGSLGTLGLIAEGIFRLHPQPPAARIVILAVSDLDSLSDATRRIMNAQIVPSALEFGWELGHGVLAVLLESIEPGVEVQAQTAQAVLEPLGKTRVLHGAQHESWQRLTTQPWQGSTAALKISVPPTALAEMTRTVTSVCDRQRVVPRIVGHAGTATVLVRCSADAERALTSALVDLRTRAMGLGGSAMLLHASPSVKREVGVFGPTGDTLPLMRRIKERFDPRHTMNPGRFVEGME